MPEKKTRNDFRCNRKRNLFQGMAVLRGVPSEENEGEKIGFLW